MTSFAKNAALVLGGFAAFCGIETYKQEPKFYSNILMPAVHRILSPENAHKAAVKFLSWNFFPASKYVDEPCLKTNVWTKDFSNPIGIAAGFDKDAEAMIGLQKIGFGFIEIGSVTPKPQPGNDKPRVFRLGEDHAVINRYGFNSCGHQTVAERLNEYSTKPCARRVVLGVNLGKNKTSSDAVADYVSGVRSLGIYADYIVVNISSPNTPGLRNLQAKKELEKLCKEVIKERNKLPDKPPVLVKIAPDLTDVDKRDISDVITQCRVDGLIVSNTTVRRPDSLVSKHKGEAGGLSGRPLTDRSTQLISEMYLLTEGKIPIVGVGGVASGRDAYDKIRAGASLVQIYTALIYDGPPLVSSVKQELSQLLQSDGFSNVSQAVGVDHAK